MDLFWRGIVLYFQELKSSLVPQDTIFFPSLWGWEDNEGVPFSGRKWWCYQIVTGKPMAWNLLHVSVVSLYLRTSRVTGSLHVWLAYSVSGPALGVCTSSLTRIWNPKTALCSGVYPRLTGQETEAQGRSVTCLISQLLCEVAFEPRAAYRIVLCCFSCSFPSSDCMTWFYYAFIAV